MATPRSQRIGIWIIAVALVLGTLGSFLVMILGGQNEAVDNQQLQKAYSDYQAKQEAQTKELSEKYYPTLSQYSTVPAVFNSDDVKKVTKNDLKVGEGEELKTDSQYSAYYIGWNPKGVVFDQSISDGSLKAPIAGGNLIEGWNEGVIGMKLGGIRELTIPSAKAYAEAGSGDNIPPNTPIKFIVMVIPTPTEIPMPDILIKYYQSQMVNDQAKQ